MMRTQLYSRDLRCETIETPDGDDGDQSPAIFNRQTPKLTLAPFLIISLSSPITSFSVTSILFHIASVGAGFS